MFHVKHFRCDFAGKGIALARDATKCVAVRSRLVRETGVGRGKQAGASSFATNPNTGPTE